MKILMISSYLPYPLLDGGKIRLYNLIKILGEKHEITLICEKRPNQTATDIEGISKICKKIITVERPKAISFKNVSRSVLTLDPLLVVTHTNREMKKKISEELKSNKFDLIHVETFYVMHNLPKTNLPIVLAEHNIEYEVYQKYADKSSIILKPALGFDILKLKKREKEAWKKAAKVVAVSPVEQKIIGNNAGLVPNGVDLNKFKFVRKNLQNPVKKVLFIGNFKWVQNRDSAAFIIRNIWPKMISKNENLRLWIVGKNIPDSLKKLADRSIVFDENAPNETELIFQEAHLLLAPIRVGGGTNFKTLESMASGTPVLTSTLGNEGIDAEPNSEILIADKPDEYAKLANSILGDKYLYEKLARNGRIFVEENFDWQKIAIKLENIYKSVLAQ
jgi:glycosyltransferase involved in cell wall biosynthesis